MVKIPSNQYVESGPAWGGTEQEAKSKYVVKVRSRYESDAEILY